MTCWAGAKLWVWLVLVLLLAVASAPSGVRAENGPVPVERLLATLITKVDGNGRLSRDGLDCETVLPDTGSGGLQDCIFPDLGLRSLWISDAASDAVSISVILQAEDAGTSGAAAGDLPVRDREALSELGQRIGAISVPELGRCTVDTGQRTAGESVVLGFRNPASASRIVVLFGISEEGLRLAAEARPGEKPEIVASVIVLNQLDTPCVPLQD